MEYNVFKRRRHWSALVVLGTLTLVVFVACYGRLYSTVRAQPPETGAISQEGTAHNLPRIEEVVFYQESTYQKYVSSRYMIKEADVIPADSRFRMENVKTLYSGYCGEGTSDYSMSPDKKCLLVSQESRGGVDRRNSDLLLVSLPSGKVKTLRGDGAGYAMLGWSSDSKLISYVSPILIPSIDARAPMPPGFQLVSYVSNESIPERPREPDRILYISAANGKWRRKVQAEVSDAVWIPGGKVIVYTSYEKPGLVVYSSDGQKAILSKDTRGGSLMLSGDGRKLLWSDSPKLQLFEIPKDSSKLLDPKAWKTVAEFNLDPKDPPVAVGLSHDGTMVALLGPVIQTLIPGGGIQSSIPLAVLNLVTKKSVVYPRVATMYPLGWSQDGHYMIGNYHQQGKNGQSTHLAAIQVDPSAISHTGAIEWDNPQPITPQILLDMPPQTGSITWRE